MSRESFIKRAMQSAAKRRSPVQEKTAARRLKGKLNPGSGAFTHKADVRKCGGILRVEAKTTERKSFSVTQDMLDKLDDAALPNNEIPVVLIEFVDGAGRPLREVAVVPTWVLDDLIDHQRE